MTGVKSKEAKIKKGTTELFKCLHTCCCTIEPICTERSSVFQVPLRLTGRKLRLLLLQLAEDRINALRLGGVIISLRGIFIFNVLLYRVMPARLHHLETRDKPSVLCLCTYMCVCVWFV